MKKVLVVAMLCGFLSVCGFGNASAQGTDQDMLSMLGLSTQSIEVMGAVQEGYQAYLGAKQYAAQGRMQLNDQERQIQQALEVTIPGIYNKIQTSSEEVQEELAQALFELAKLVIANQSTYSVSLDSIDSDNAFVALITIATLASSEVEARIDQRVKDILQQEQEQMMEQQIQLMQQQMQGLFGL